ncbi:MAG: hypothetical protein HeimC2_09040 [Candidatus Heimdallarchaeota archaeon LC_2]|nr:MAG: hypothetical protein HeimC2_09040 [Candidatus Heimdallarchaeota archaeon LC_2]
MSKVENLSNQTYQFKQRTRSLFKFQEAYEVTNPETKEKLFFGKRDRLWLKRDLRVFQGIDDKGPEYLFLKDNSIFDKFGSFTAMAPDGQVMGLVRRKFWRSFFLRETYEFESPEGELVGKAQADGSIFKTWFRKLRILRIIPFIGPILAMLMRLQLEYIDINGNQFATFKRKVSLRDFYKLVMADGDLPIPQGILIGMSMLFDSAEGR